MDDERVEVVNPEPMPADRAAVWSLRVAFLSIVAAGLGLWFANFFGIMACNIGLLFWWLLWIAAIVLAVSALRGAYASQTPEIVRRRAKVSLVVCGVNMVLSLGFLWWLAQAVERLQ